MIQPSVLHAAYLLIATACTLSCNSVTGQDKPSPESTKKKERIRSLVVFPEKETGIRVWMKLHGWETQRGNPRYFRVGNGQLHMVSRKDSVAIGLERGFPVLTSKWPRIRFKIRVLSIPSGSDLKKKSGDDAAFRLYVGFDRNKGWFHPPHTIAYTWTENVDRDRIIQSPHFKEVRYLSIGIGLPPRGADSKEAWITIERDLRKDYRRAFPEDRKGVPALKGILLKCDSNNTGTSAKALVRSIELAGPAREN